MKFLMSQNEMQINTGYTKWKLMKYDLEIEK